jgi:hypothetical protein
VNGSDRRDRLIGFASDYLAAFAARNLSAIKFAPNLRHTENCVPLPIGAGAIRTATGFREGGHFFVDVASGQVEYWGVLEQLGGAEIFGVRLKFDGVLIGEIETLVVGNTDPYYFPDELLAFDGGFHDIVPEPDRASRATLIEIAHRYFDGIEQDDGALVPATADCLRLVNGAHDTVTDVSALGPSEAHRALTVQAQMTGGHYAYIEGLRARRFPIIDEERGLILAHVSFDHPGDIGKPDGGVIFGRPNTMMAFEVFKVAAGEVRAVWAICHKVPYGLPSGWGEGEPRVSASVS